MTAASHSQTEPRPLTPAELAAIIVTYRHANGWSQEQLADISGLTVRTIQRVEKAEPSSIDTKRALARAFEVEDIDAFNKPHSFKTAEQMLKDAEEFKAKNMLLDAIHATSGKQLGELAEQMNMHHMTIPDGIAVEAATDLAGLYDNLRDYCDVSGHYGFTQKVEFYGFLDELVATIRKHGLSICYGVRRTRITNDSWVDRTPWPVTIACD